MLCEWRAKHVFAPSALHGDKKITKNKFCKLYIDVIAFNHLTIKFGHQKLVIFIVYTI